MAVQLIERPTADAGEITFEDYLQMEPTNLRHEIIDGKLIMSPSPTDDHQIDLSNLNDIVGDYVRDKDLGVVMFAPMDLIIRKLPKLTTRQPDLAFFSWESIGGKGRAALRSARQRGVAPDIAVEILSPDYRKSKLQHKLLDFASIGIREVWLASRQAMTFEVLVLAGDEYVRSGFFTRGQGVISTILPDLEFRVEDVFDDK